MKFKLVVFLSALSLLSYAEIRKPASSELVEQYTSLTKELSSVTKKLKAKVKNQEASYDEIFVLMRDYHVHNVANLALEVSIIGLEKSKKENNGKEEARFLNAVGYLKHLNRDYAGALKDL